MSCRTGARSARRDAPIGIRPHHNWVKAPRRIPGRAWLGIAAGVVALFALLYWFAQQWQDDLWRVAVPGLVTGLGTALLAIVTVWQAQADREQRVGDRDDRERELAAQQARQIIAFVGRTPLHGGEYTSGDVIVVRNTSHETVLDIKLGEVRAGGRPDELDQVWDHGSGGSYRTFLEPHDEVSFTGNWHGAEAGRTLTEAARGNAVVSFEWIDSRGQHWQRSGSDAPTQAD